MKLQTILHVIELLIGGGVLFWGADWLVRGSAGLARRLGVKALVIGLTVVAYGTSAPELAVSSKAVIDHAGPIALANILGSCIANLGLILGITALVKPPVVDARLIRRELPVLVLSVAAVPLVLLDGQVSRIEGAILVACALAFTIITLTIAALESSDADAADDAARDRDGGAPAGGAALAAAEGQVSDAALDAELILAAPEAVAPDASTGLRMPGAIRLFIFAAVGLGLLVLGSELFIRGARGSALALGLSERMVGLTVVAIGTSLPELAAALMAALRGYSALAVGNLVGSCIFNVFLVLGVVAFIRPIHATASGYLVDLGAMVAISLLAIVFMRGSRRISRLEGLILLAAYVGFIVTLAVT